MNTATIIEATPKGTFTHEMPLWLQEAYVRGFNMRLFRSVSGFVSALPCDYKNLVKSGSLVPYPKPVPKPSFVFYDELASPDEIQRAMEHWKNQRGASA
jgi:hypothetical protein